MIRIETGKLTFWRYEITDLIRVVREQCGISGPRRQRADVRELGSPASIGGLSLSYYDILTTPKKLIKFRKIITKVLNVFDLEAVFTIKPPNGEYVLFSFQVYQKEI